MKISKEFAQHWIEAWNSHDLKSILGHYADDFLLTSPAIVQVTGNPNGYLKGKEDIGRYWNKALELFPDLKFELAASFIGINSIAIQYKGVKGREVVEVLVFNSEGQVCEASVFYAQADNS